MTRLHARNKSVIAFQVLSHLLRIQSNSRIEVGESDDENHIDDVIHQTSVVQHIAYPPGSTVTLILDNGQRDEHQCLRKDDRHHISSKQLQRDVLSCTTILLVANQTLCILDRHLACTLNEQDRSHDDSIKDKDLYNEHHESTTRDGSETRANLLHESLRQAGNNTQHDDQRDTISYTLISNALTQPKDEHTTCG